MNKDGRNNKNEIHKNARSGERLRYVNCFKEKIDNPPEVAKIVSNRHFGIGSDGLIMINPSKVADFEMEMYNADGSRGEMCGNGSVVSQSMSMITD